MIPSHHCFCSVMPGRSYCFMWNNDAINLNRSVSLHFFFFFLFVWHAPRFLAYRYIALIKKGLDPASPCAAQKVDVFHYQKQQRLHAGAIKDKPWTKLSTIFENCHSFACTIPHAQKNSLKKTKNKKLKNSSRLYMAARKALHHLNKGRLCCCAVLLFHIV